MNFLEEVKQSPEILKSLQKYLDNPRGVLLLAGHNGTGKTFAAGRIFDKINQDDLREYPFHDNYFLTQAELNIRWISQQNEYGDTLHLLNSLRSCKVFVIDDLGTRTPSDAFMDFLYAIIDSRYSRSYSTIITTNLNSIMMRERFGDAFVSRVASGEVIRFNGEDRRFKEF